MMGQWMLMARVRAAIRYISVAMDSAIRPHRRGAGVFWRRPGRSRAALAVIGAVLAGGCQSGPLPPAPRAAEAYEAGEYAKAYNDATAEHGRTTGLRRDRAALMAGLSAHALGRQDDARSWLRPLTSHSDRDISGRASAALGLVEADRRHHESAAALLSAAGRKLSGEAAANANFQAAESYAALGRHSTARLHYRLARASAGDAGLRALIDERLAMDGFALQFGAYSTMVNAERRLAEIRAWVSALGLGEPRIVERFGSHGKTLYLVHVGSYATEREANDARARLAGGAVVARAER